MLLFIPGYRWTSRASILFQYISCYSLSNLLIMKRYCKNMFQYISCYSLSWGRRQPTEQTDVSIHLMLLFIEDELSKIADSGRFNTSHVTLYRYIRGIIIVILWFQYISCYSLSIPEDVQDKIKKLFQYISCYSLSVWSSLSFLKWFVSIHLMLLFIRI